mmetsp:Transcript_3735/g.8219  ORF Transcript_3735/g.8219 Transcript_3735/m.8219 type:complete len:346 (+) Transcript_3735:3-1040(+)
MESAARHNAHAGLIEQLHTIQNIRLDSSPFRLNTRALTQPHAREAIHRAVRTIAAHAFQRAQRLYHLHRLPPERVHDRLVLRVPQLIRRIADFRTIHKHRSHHLPDHVRAQVHRHHLIHLIHHALIKPIQLHIPSAHPALPKHPLRGRMERRQLHSALRRATAFILILRHDSLERHKRRFIRVVHVFLVHLVRQQHQIMLLTEPHDLRHVLLRQHRACRVAWINHSECTWRDSIRTRVLHCPPELRHRERPVGILVEVVADLGAAEERERGGVERVLRDWDEHAVGFVADEQAEHGFDSFGRAVGEEQKLRVDGSGAVVARRDEGRDFGADGRDTFGSGVRAGAA